MSHRPHGHRMWTLSGKLRFSLLVLCVGACALVFQSTLRSEAKKEVAEKVDFVRFIENEKNGQLQTALASYKNAAGQVVDLVGAVHVGDAAYYQNLNERFKSYGVVLYELVANPEDFLNPDPEETPAPSMISMLQRTMKNVLKLEFQLDIIDYKAVNFVHADLTPEAFSKMQKERGESIFTLILNAMNAQAATGIETKIGLGQLFRVFTSRDSASELKLLVAQQFEEMEQLMDASEGEKGTVLITGRNEQVIKVLKEQLKKDVRKLAIFYGAGHLLDLEERLLDLGFKKTGQEWLTAWNIRKPKRQKASTEAP